MYMFFLSTLVSSMLFCLANHYVHESSQQSFLLLPVWQLHIQLHYSNHLILPL